MLMTTIVHWFANLMMIVDNYNRYTQASFQWRWNKWKKQLRLVFCVLKKKHFFPTEKIQENGFQFNSIRTKQKNDNNKWLLISDTHNCCSIDKKKRMFKYIIVGYHYQIQMAGHEMSIIFHINKINDTLRKWTRNFQQKKNRKLWKIKKFNLNEFFFSIHQHACSNNHHDKIEQINYCFHIHSSDIINLMII